MTPYFETDRGKLYHGDCLGVMRELEADSIGAMVTDPPYGLSFMGKEWDYDVPSVEVWRECLRILKPGAHALIFAGSRTQHRMAVNVEDAGFALKDTLMWLYGSGFPKSTDISKQIDKAAGKERKGAIQGGHIGISRSGGDSTNDKGMVIDRNIPHVIGKGELTRGTPATPEAEFWNGWKTHLKPAYEPIILAMKPNDGSYAANALKHGVAGLNIDGCRIEGDWSRSTTTRSDIRGGNLVRGKVKHWETGKGQQCHSGGRYPANVLLDEEAARMLDEQSGVSKSRANIRRCAESQNRAMSGKNYKRESRGHQDSGGASRFFYTAKASASEREKFNKHPTVKPLKLITYLLTLLSYSTDIVTLDPFCGSGTMPVACEHLKRRWIACEMEEKYCEIAAKRIEAAASQLSFEDYL